jgi:hypothetical protein
VRLVDGLSIRPDLSTVVDLIILHWSKTCKGNEQGDLP